MKYEDWIRYEQLRRAASCPGWVSLDQAETAHTRRPAPKPEKKPLRFIRINFEQWQSGQGSRL